MQQIPTINRETYRPKHSNSDDWLFVNRMPPGIKNISPEEALPSFRIAEMAHYQNMLKESVCKPISEIAIARQKIESLRS